MVLDTERRQIGFSAIIYIIYNAYYISGYNGAYHNYIITAVFLLWFFVAFLEDSKALSYAVSCKAVVYLIVYMLFYFFSSSIIANISYTLEYIMVFLTFYCCIVQFRYYSARGLYKEHRFIVVVTFAIFIFFAMKAIAFYTMFPSAARTLAADYNAFGVLAIGGGYAIAFGSAILIVGLFEFLVYRKTLFSKQLSLFFIFCIILFFYLLIKTESTTTLLSAVIGLIIVLVRRIAHGKGQGHTNKLLGTLLVLVLVLLVLLNLDNIGKLIMNSTGSNMDNLLSRRFYRIGEKMYSWGGGPSISNYVDSRWDTVRMSWETFKNHPFLGVGYRCGNIFFQLENFGVGTHSEICDILAQHGIVGAIPFFLFFVNSIKSIAKNNYLYCYFITMLVMMLFNPFRYYHGYYVAFSLLPMIFSMLQTKWCNICEKSI